MVEEARRRSLCLGVFENVRYGVPTRVARWLIDAGYLGTPQMACRFDLGSAAWGPDLIVAETPWRHQKLLAGGGASLDIGVHAFHWLRYLLGDPVALSGTTSIFEPRRVQRDSSGQVVAEVARHGRRLLRHRHVPGRRCCADVVRLGGSRCAHVPGRSSNLRQCRALARGRAAAR